ncbi:MAG: response regulator [Polyangiaceae bacterium]|nr:response regulator [Polyangiaceae bacterium]
MPVDPMFASLLVTFVAEVEEIHEVVSSLLLSLEREESAETRRRQYNEVARHIHNLKGTSGTLGLDDLSHLMHALEDIFGPHVKGGNKLAPDVATTVLFGFDTFLRRLREHTAGAPPASGVDDTIAAMRAKVEAKPEAEAPAADADADDKAGERVTGWRVRASDVGDVARDVERLRELRFRTEQRIHQLDALAHTLQGAAHRVVRRSVLDLRRGLVTDRDEAANLVASFEHSIKAICTLPVRTIAAPWERMVRDLCRKTNKRVKLSVVGGDVALDRRLLESLRSPLLHLVRNAVDHGIELPAERERLGKHSEGAVVVRFETRGNVLAVEVSDDGGGIDVDRVRQEALRRGLASEAALSALTNEQALRLVFHAGLSTRREVTETSGRGVGLDVVRAEVAALRGHLDVTSVPREGSRFLLTLASGLGSSASLLVRVGDQRLAVPMHAIECVVRAPAPPSLSEGSLGTIEHVGAPVPIWDLGAMLALREARAPSRGDPILVLAPHGHPVAIAVDEVSSDVDLVTHPLPTELAEVDAYDGAATGSSGELILVLRPAWLTRIEPAVVEAPIRRALVVDDSMTARALHRTVLEAAGYRVHTAPGADHALELARRTAYDVIVCDVAMSGIDGIELTRRFRAEPLNGSTPVVLVSALDDDIVRRRATAAGASAFLTKRECAGGKLLTTIEAMAPRPEEPS